LIHDARVEAWEERIFVAATERRKYYESVLASFENWVDAKESGDK
jgi:hypothetical protein